MATFFCRKLFADSRIHKWDRGISLSTNNTCTISANLSIHILLLIFLCVMLCNVMAVYDHFAMHAAFIHVCGNHSGVQLLVVSNSEF